MRYLHIWWRLHQLILDIWWFGNISWAFKDLLVILGCSSYLLDLLVCLCSHHCRRLLLYDISFLVNIILLNLHLLLGLTWRCRSRNRRITLSNIISIDRLCGLGTCFYIQLLSNHHHVIVLILWWKLLNLGFINFISGNCLFWNIWWRAVRFLLHNLSKSTICVYYITLLNYMSFVYIFIFIFVCFKLISLPS